MGLKRISRLPRASRLSGAALVEVEDDDRSFSATVAQLKEAVGEIEVAPFIVDDAIDVDAAGALPGDMFVFEAGVWRKLAAGTAGYVLTSNGPGQIPTWQPAQAAPPTPGIITIDSTTTTIDSTNVTIDAS
jgi:hypothetical protein